MGVSDKSGAKTGYNRLWYMRGMKQRKSQLLIDRLQPLKPAFVRVRQAGSRLIAVTSAWHINWDVSFQQTTHEGSKQYKLASLPLTEHATEPGRTSVHDKYFGHDHGRNTSASLARSLHTVPVDCARVWSSQSSLPLRHYAHLPLSLCRVTDTADVKWLVDDVLTCSAWLHSKQASVLLREQASMRYINLVPSSRANSSGESVLQQLTQALRPFMNHQQVRQLVCSSVGGADEGLDDVSQTLMLASQQALEWIRVCEQHHQAKQGRRQDALGIVTFQYVVLCTEHNLELVSLFCQHFARLALCYLWLRARVPKPGKQSSASRESASSTPGINIRDEHQSCLQFVHEAEPAYAIETALLTNDIIECHTQNWSSHTPWQRRPVLHHSLDLGNRHSLQDQARAITPVVCEAFKHDASMQLNYQGVGLFELFDNVTKDSLTALQTVVIAHADAGLVRRIRTREDFKQAGFNPIPCNDLDYKHLGHSLQQQLNQQVCFVMQQRFLLPDTMEQLEPGSAGLFAERLARHITSGTTEKRKKAQQFMHVLRNCPWLLGEVFVRLQERLPSYESVTSVQLALQHWWAECRSADSLATTHQLHAAVVKDGKAAWDSLMLAEEPGLVQRYLKCPYTGNASQVSETQRHLSTIDQACRNVLHEVVDQEVDSPCLSDSEQQVWHSQMSVSVAQPFLTPLRPSDTIPALPSVNDIGPPPALPSVADQVPLPPPVCSEGPQVPYEQCILPPLQEQYTSLSQLGQIAMPLSPLQPAGHTPMRQTSNPIGMWRQPCGSMQSSPAFSKSHAPFMPSPALSSCAGAPMITLNKYDDAFRQETLDKTRLELRSFDAGPDLPASNNDYHSGTQHHTSFSAADASFCLEQSPIGFMPVHVSPAVSFVGSEANSQIQHQFLTAPNSTASSTAERSITPGLLNLSISPVQQSLSAGWQQHSLSPQQSGNGQHQSGHPQHLSANGKANLVTPPQPCSNQPQPLLYSGQGMISHSPRSASSGVYKSRTLFSKPTAFMQLIRSPSPSNAQSTQPLLSKYHTQQAATALVMMHSTSRELNSSNESMVLPQ